MTCTKTMPTPKVALTVGGLCVVPARDPRERLADYAEVYAPADPDAAKREGRRCLNCGAAFCMPDSGYDQGCPIYNKIPEWNELVRLGRWRDAYDRLDQTNPFPEFTARVCPAPCEDACILGINETPIQIKGVERAIIDRAFDEGWVRSHKPAPGTGKRVGIVGSGPAGLAAAEILNRQGHAVTIYERNDLPGGLLRYGVPNMKLDKKVLDRRIKLMTESGVRFQLLCEVGKDITRAQLFADHDAIVLACGALKPRELNLPGRELSGIVQAIPYLTASMRAVQARKESTIDARGLRVAVIGAGDTGADCLATALRQGAESVINLARGEASPNERDAQHPWPGPKGTLPYDYAHTEAAQAQGGDPRCWQVSTQSFIAHQADTARVGALEVRDESGVLRRIPIDMVILAVGFTGHDSGPLLDQFKNPDGSSSTSTSPPVVIAGDMAIGPSLVVHAIAEGKRAAAEVEILLNKRNG